MAPDTIIFHHFNTGFADENNLWLGPHGEYGSMPEPVFGFEKIFVKDVVMGYMTIVTAGFTPVGAVAPRGELRGHDMAIHADRGIIGKIGIGP